MNGTLEGTIALDMPWLRNHAELIREISKYYGLDHTLVAAIISRESGGGRLLGRWGSPPGTGDKGHGRGLMQIDDRWHTAFTGINGFWESAAGNISYGCYVLRNFLRVADKRLTVLPEQGRDRVAIASYNCGFSNVMRALRDNRDVDAFTTDQDYSAEVLERRNIIVQYEDWHEDETLRPAPTDWHEDEARVSQVQALLNSVTQAGLEIDGDYGPRTTRAVEIFQGRAGLLIDGDVDEVTWRELVDIKARLEQVSRRVEEYARRASK